MDLLAKVPDREIMDITLHEIGHGTGTLESNIHLKFTQEGLDYHGGAEWLPGGNEDGIYDPRNGNDHWWGPNGFLK